MAPVQQEISMANRKRRKTSEISIASFKNVLQAKADDNESFSDDSFDELLRRKGAKKSPTKPRAKLSWNHTSRSTGFRSNYRQSDTECVIDAAASSVIEKSASSISRVRPFLTSLSGPSNNSSVRDHPEAICYFNEYEGRKEELSRCLFKLFNNEVFGTQLPNDLSLEWNGRMTSTAGFLKRETFRTPAGIVRTSKIVLSSKVLDSAEKLRDTLIHEMCHAAVWIIDKSSEGHGPLWKAWARKGNERFPELPKISRCHEYELKLKYTYKCTNCGYKFSRNRKSINIATNRCGYCRGVLEIIENY